MSTPNPYAPPQARVDDVGAGAVTYFPVSRLKLAAMSVVTFGLYLIYWFYKNWKAMQAAGEKLNAPLRALFYPLTAYWLFRHIGQRGEALGVAPFSAGALAAALFVLSLTYRLPEPWWLIGFLSVVPLFPVQMAINEINRRVAPQADPNSRFSAWNIVALVLGGILFALAVLGSFVAEE